MRALLVLLVTSAALVAGGCEVAARVTIVVDHDGSGDVRAVVEMDAAAVAAVTGGQGGDAGAAIEEAVRLDDLVAAGWSVRWEHDDAGGATVRLAKPFASPEDLGAVVAELSGPHGPLQGVALERSDGVLSTEYSVTGTADLSAVTLGIAADPELVSALVAERVDVAALEARLDESLADALRFEVAVSLPGDDLWVIDVEPGTTSDLATSHTEWDLAAVGLLLAAVGFVVLAVVIVVIGRRKRQNRRRGTSVPTP